MKLSEFELDPKRLGGQALTIMWFRQDLRLRDNPALRAAAASEVVLPVYILDDKNAGEWKMGGASRWWLHHSLLRLNEALNDSLWVLKGDAVQELVKLCELLPVRKLVWNRCYEPWRRKRDNDVQEILRDSGANIEVFNGSLLWEPWETAKTNGMPYGVFTPFYRNLLTFNSPDQALSEPPSLSLVQCPQPPGRIDRLGLKPRIPWDTGLEHRWTPGEAAALAQLEKFSSGIIQKYQEKRDFPSANAVSALSPHLHFGEISPRRIWQQVKSVGIRDDGAAYIRQLCWREFSYHLLHHYPTMPDKDLKPVLKGFPWCDESKLLQRWQNGETGIPLVDAGMRELWKTGTMHNRVRMVTASFLTKNLLVNWLNGARWFWDCLVDADLASNSFGWQWVAGCGADAVPYFRIFNPVLQSRKFDPNGEYLRRWLPELSHLSDRNIHAPWQVSSAVLRAANVSLDENYSAPVVDLPASRERALALWKSLRN